MSNRTGNEESSSCDLEQGVKERRRSRALRPSLCFMPLITRRDYI